MIQEIDYGTIILENTDQINRICEDIEIALKDKPPLMDEIDGSLVILSAAVMRILNIIFPIKNIKEILGLPSEVITGEKTPEPVFFDRDNHDWDFKPWFQQKFSEVYKAYFEIIDTADTTLKREKLERPLQILKTYNKTIFDMLNSGRIIIKDVIIDEDN